MYKHPAYEPTNESYWCRKCGTFLNPDHVCMDCGRDYSEAVKEMEIEQ